LSAPKIVKTVQHRVRDSEGRALGHVGVVQRRNAARLKKYGGRRFASWARRTLDGEVTGTPERYETYDTEAEALAHAAYSAGQATPSAVELETSGGRLP
jgi:hypothetical protein